MSCSSRSEVDGGPDATLVEGARELSRHLLQHLDGGRRWRHTQAVARRASQAAVLLTPGQASVLQAAAWMHDIGYAQPDALHAFHPVDGAGYVQAHLPHPVVAGLVAHHSGARFVAVVRGVSRLLLPFPDRNFWTGPIADALTWADQTTSPDGETVSVEQRLAEMLHRHGPDSPNARAHAQRAPGLFAAVHATETRLTAHIRLTSPYAQR